MLQSLEHRIEFLPNGGQEDFALWCAEALGGGCGEAMLKQLIAMEDPTMSPAFVNTLLPSGLLRHDRLSNDDMLITIGRREVIAVLWRRSQQQIVPADAAAATAAADWKAAFEQERTDNSDLRDRLAICKTLLESAKESSKIAPADVPKQQT